MFLKCYNAQTFFALGGAEPSICMFSRPGAFVPVNVFTPASYICVALLAGRLLGFLYG
jgi:hypothetical protein